MAQPPHPHPKPEPPKPAAKHDEHEAKGKDQHVPLRDPSGGREPAVVRRDARPDEQLGYPPTIGVKGEPIEDGERDPDTIAEEQRMRSAEMEAMGSEAWKAAHDERSRNELDNALPAPGARKLEHDKREPIARRP
jgi:hypothetical protein